MMWVLWSFIAIAAGFILYSSIQDQVPEELSFLKLGTAGSAAVVVGEDSMAEGDAQVSTYYTSSAKHWTVIRQPSFTEVVRDFGNPVLYSGQNTQPPTLHVICMNQQLYIGLDSRLRVAGDDKQAAVIVDSQQQAWLRAPEQRLYTANVGALKERLLNNKPMTLTLHFVEAGEQRFTLNPEGFAKALNKLPPVCLR